MKIVQITTDSREHFKEYDRPEPYFGTAPAGLLSGFADFPDVEVHVISCAHRSASAPEKIGPNIWFHQPVLGNWAWGRTLFLGCALAVRKIIREIDPDIVHGQGTERDCAMSAVLSAYPNVLTLHGNMRVHAKRLENRGNTYYRMASFLEGYCLKRTHGVIAISNYTRDLVADACERTWLLPNAVDKRFFKVSPQPPSVPRLLVVGSIDERKNPVGLIEACESMLKAGTCTIAFAGQGNPADPYVQHFEGLVRDLPGLEVLGFLDRDELAAQFAQSTAVVLPTYEDNCPMVVLEGMAAGLPVAASRVGGVPDLIKDEVDGLLFDPTRPDTMCKALERLCGDESLRERLAETARETALKRFHPKIIAEGHLVIYREVLGR